MLTINRLGWKAAESFIISRKGAIVTIRFYDATCGTGASLTKKLSAVYWLVAPLVASENKIEG